jgi:hypothetical protein
MEAAIRLTPWVTCLILLTHWKIRHSGEFFYLYLGFRVLESELHESKRALSSYLEAAAAEYTSDRLSFWKKGLQLQEKDSDECPMCEEPTLDEEKREEIRGRLEKSSEFTEAKENLQDFISDFSRRLHRISSRVDNLFPRFLTSSRRESLINLFEESDPLQSFLTIHDGSWLASIKTRDTLNDLADSAEEIPDLASDPESVQEAKERLLRMENELNRAIESICSTAESYAEAYENLEEELEEIIASDDAVKQVDALLEPLNQWEAVKVLAEYHELLDEAREARRNLSDHLQEKQDERLEDRGDEIKEWYSVMNPAANVAPSRLDAGAESLRIYAEAFGAELNAAAGLSQCQANTLGLSIHFMRTLAPNSPYDFVVLDDPVQSMDDDHSEALIRDVIDNLTGTEDTQTIILTHTEELSDRIWRLNYEKPLQLRYLRFSNMDKSGPTLRGKKSLFDELKKVKDLAKGNEESRELAVDRLRIATERLIKLICESQGRPIPDSRKYRMASQKLNHLRKCSDVKPNYVATIEDTINFCNPAHHDTEEWGVPTEEKIIRHRGTIYNYADKFDVLRSK